MIGALTPAAADPVLEFSSALDSYTATTLSMGWSFTANEAISVTALDAYAPGSGVQVRLYDGSGDILAEITVSTGDPQEGSPTPFYSQSITPVTLAAGTTYYVAQDYPGGDVLPWLDFVPGLTTDPAITYTGQVAALYEGNDPTSDTYGGYAAMAYFGPNLDIETAVPGPPSLTVFAAALVGLGLALGRRAA
jgi:hypothetical protein